MRKMKSVCKFYVKCLILDYLLDYLRNTNYKQKEISKILHVSDKTIRTIKRKLQENHYLKYDDLIEKKHGPSTDDYKKISKPAWMDLENALKFTPRKFNLSYAG